MVLKKRMVSKERNDYNCMNWNPRYKMSLILRALPVLAGLGFLFFDSLAAAGIFALGSVAYPAIKERAALKKRRKELNGQFRDALFTMASFLNIGRSLEDAVLETRRELAVLFPDEKARLTREFELISRMIELNRPVEQGFFDMADRSGLEDIRSFAEVIAVCRRTGGNLVHVVQNTASIIGAKMDILDEIEVMLAKQRLEQKMLNGMPLVFIGLLRLGGGGYMDALYDSGFGFPVMGLVLGIIVLANLVSGKIVDIEV